MKDTEQQVEELEINYSILTEDKCYDLVRNFLKEEAKLLKAEIEKGCDNLISGKTRCGDFGGKYFCPTCQNLIERLNKIIGEEE